MREGDLSEHVRRAGTGAVVRGRVHRGQSAAPVSPVKRFRLRGGGALVEAGRRSLAGTLDLDDRVDSHRACVAPGDDLAEGAASPFGRTRHERALNVN